MLINRVKGTRDIFSKNAKAFNLIKDTFFDVAKKYNYSFIETPIIEDASLFIRSVGETSDIVSKEMYLFKDHGNNLIALRPEATASTIRAYVENKINNFNGETKLFYFGPMFRYERPQKGRFRQFYQGGIEMLSPKSILTNFEIIKFASDFLNELKINDFVLEINNLGSFESRNKYIQELKKYFLQFKSQLSEQSQIRLGKNVLRILDDKEDSEKDFVKKAPKLWDFLTKTEQQEFNDLLKLLKKFNINYSINYSLVRGLDYYNDIVFEFVSTSEALGTKSTILGGGRYNGMVEELGGPKTDSIGFAFGVDRIMEIILFNEKEYEELNDNLDILIGFLNEKEENEVICLAYELRKKYSTYLLNEKQTPKSLFKKQFNLKPKYLIFKELNCKENEFKIKSFDGKETISICKGINDFENVIKKLN